MTEDNVQRILFLIAVLAASTFVYREVRRGNTGIFREFFGWMIPQRAPQSVSSFSTEQPAVAQLESTTPVAAPIMSNQRAYRYDRRHAAQMRAHIRARKPREVGKPEAGSQPGSCEHLHINEKGLSKGQWAELEAWVRGGKQGFTQERWSIVMAKRPKTIGEAVRTIEQRLAAAPAPSPVVQRAVQPPVKQAEDEEAGQTFIPAPDAPAPEPYMSPQTFMRVKHAA